ncbi:MAG: IS110 family transposase, partial [Chloroflexales bacterium]|nr:IS110 family transposase [Chloroflexales bacterium]
APVPPDSALPVLALASTPADTCRWAARRAIGDAAPRIGPRIAEAILAELGTDRSRFPSAAHVAIWVGLAPGQHERAGKRWSSRIRKAIASCARR